MGKGKRTKGETRKVKGRKGGKKKKKRGGNGKRRGKKIKGNR